MALFRVLALFLAALLAPALFAELNSICRDGAVPWRCKSIDTCTTLEKDDTLQICGFNGKPMVCCPPTAYSYVPRQPVNTRNNTRN